MCVWVRALTTLLSWEDGTLRPSVRLGPPPPLCPAGRAGPARWPTAPASVGWANQSPTRGGGGGPCGEVVAVLGEGEGVDRALPARQHAAPQPRRVPGSVRAATAGPATGVGGCRRSRRRPRTRHGTADGGGGGGLVGGEGDDVVLGLDVPHAHKAIRRARPQDQPVRMELRVAAAPSPSHAMPPRRRLTRRRRACAHPARLESGWASAPWPDLCQGAARPDPDDSCAWSGAGGHASDRSEQGAGQGVILKTRRRARVRAGRGTCILR